MTVSENTSVSVPVARFISWKKVSVGEVVSLVKVVTSLFDTETTEYPTISLTADDGIDK